MCQISKCVSWKLCRYVARERVYVQYVTFIPLVDELSAMEHIEPTESNQRGNSGNG
jgi:hypothetical protein